MSDRLTAVDAARLRSRRWWKEEDALRVLAAWRASGVSVRAFAHQHGLGMKRMLWWKQRLASWRTREAKEKKLLPARLVPVVPIGLEPPAVSLAIRLVGGAVVEVADTSAVEPEWVSRLMRGLAERV